MHHLMRVLGLPHCLVLRLRLWLRLPDRTDDRGRRNLRGPAHYSFWRPVVDHGSGLWWFRCHTLLVDIFHVSLQVSFLFKFFCTEVAAVLVVPLPVDPDHVTAEAALALELFKADVAIVTGSLMFCLNVHISATG
jgi:hypothetical protein